MMENEDVSIVVGVRDRSDTLIRAMYSWLYHKNVKEIIVVDYGSITGHISQLDTYYCFDPRIKVYRIGNANSW